MAKHSATVAVSPGSFDPITNGHLDVIRRGACLFDELVVAVGDNPEKSSSLPASRRAEMVRKAVAKLENVRVQTYSGLTVDFARSVGAGAILRGLRGSSDLHFERSTALTNRRVAGVETVFVLPAPEHSFISSSLVRQVVRGGGDVSALVPGEVLSEIEAAYRTAV